MADPKYYTGDDVNRRIRALIRGKPHQVSSATISVWNPSDSQVVSDQGMTVVGTDVTYQISGAVITVAGTYKVEADVVFANNQGTLSHQETFVVTARFP